MTEIAANVTLDALFRRNATLRGDLPAIRDMDGTLLSYAQTSSAVANVAEEISALGLPQRSTVALLLPNGRELIVALLAALRCGLTPVPMPVAWRKSDLVRACRESEAAALITTAHFAPERLPELAAEVAIEVFELSFPCAFGGPLPDGLMPLTFNTAAEPLLATASLTAQPASGIATLQPSSKGVSFVLHSDDELLAAGLGAMLAGDIRGGDAIVSAVSFASFAGLATALVPWLLNSGTLSLLPELPRGNEIVLDKNTHLVAHDGLLPSLLSTTDAAVASVFALHLAGTSGVTAYPALNARTVVDVFAFGELAAIALPRVERSAIAQLPIGIIHAGNGGSAAPSIVETAVDQSGLQIRGAMVPKDVLRDQEWLSTGYELKDRYISPPDDLTSVGGLRFDFPDLERRVRAAALISDIYKVSDPVLGSKVLIESERPEETAAALLAAGLPRVIAASVRKAETAQAKAG